MSSGVGWPDDMAPPDTAPPETGPPETGPPADAATRPSETHAPTPENVSRETGSEAPLSLPETPPDPAVPPAGDDHVADVSRETTADPAYAAPAPQTIPAVPPPLPAITPLSPDASDTARQAAAPDPGDVSRETANASAPPAQMPAQWPRPSRRRVLTVANQKGGVGKTTSTVNLAVALAQHGIRVLVIDLDPQGNSSTAFNLAHTAGTPSIYDVLIGTKTLSEVSVAVPEIPHLWCAPATIDLAGAEIELVSVVARESRLRRALDTVGDVDYVFIDCPPSLGLLTLNAMVAADEVLIPIQCEFYALEGLSQLLNNVDLVKNHLNAGLAVSTILLTMYDARTRLADQVAAEVRAHFGGLVLNSVIPRSVRVSEAPGFGQTVVTFDPASRGAVAYVEAAYDLAVRGADGAHAEVAQ